MTMNNNNDDECLALLTVMLPRNEISSTIDDRVITVTTTTKKEKKTNKHQLLYLYCNNVAVATIIISTGSVKQKSTTTTYCNYCTAITIQNQIYKFIIKLVFYFINNLGSSYSFKSENKVLDCAEYLVLQNRMKNTIIDFNPLKITSVWIVFIYLFRRIFWYLKIEIKNT